MLTVRTADTVWMVSKLMMFFLSGSIFSTPTISSGLRTSFYA